MDIEACPRCASLKMRPPTVQDGMALLGDETRFYVCGECDFRGMPLLFDDKEAYQAFRDRDAAPGPEEADGATPRQGDAPDGAQQQGDAGDGAPQQGDTPDGASRQGDAQERFDDLGAMDAPPARPPIWPWLLTVVAGLSVAVWLFVAADKWFGWTGNIATWPSILFGGTLTLLAAWAVLRIASQALERAR